MRDISGFTGGSIRFEKSDVEGLVSNLRRGDCDAALADLNRVVQRTGSDNLRECFDAAQFAPIMFGGEPR